MAETNQVTLNRATVTGGEKVRTETISEKHVQLIKLLLGAAGIDDGPVSGANPLPASDATAQARLQGIIDAINGTGGTNEALLALVAALADPATQTTLAAVLAKLSADPSTDSGVSAAAASIIAQLQANLAGTQPVSAADLPLPTGAATQATLAAISAVLDSWKVTTAAAAQVVQLSEIPGSAYLGEIVNLTNVRQRLTYTNGVWAAVFQYKRSNRGALTSWQAGKAADVNAAVAANNGLVLMGYSCRESAGTPAPAAFNIVNGATGAAAGKVVAEELAADGAKTVWLGPDGIACPDGISINVISGTVDVALHYRYTGRRLFFVRNEPDTGTADAKLASASTRESVWVDESGPTIITAVSQTDLITTLDIRAEFAETEKTILQHSAVGNAP